MLWFFLQFRGRISRAPFLLGFLLILLVQLFFVYRVTMAVPGMPLNESVFRMMYALPANDTQRMWMEILSVVGFATAIPMTAIHVKRLHDVGLTGLVAFLAFVPVVNLVVFLALCVTRGTSGPNKYGSRVNDLG
jgi:uncharacterized membrane protein YhaH (DUF805 family)